MRHAHQRGEGKGLKRAKRISRLKISLSCLENTFFSIIFCCGLFSSPLVKYQRAQLLDYVAKICLVLKRTAKLYSKGTAHFALPPAVNKSSYFSTFSPAFDVVSILDFGPSNRCAAEFHRCFNLHCPDDIWCGALFHMLLAICISSMVRRLFRSSAYFLIEWVGCFLTVEF